ncbi:MAG TPA: aldose epimerase family protein [Tepidisphaeraceae bacterium]|jgi:aldose 1-epimerase
MKIEKQPFGTADTGQKVDLFTLSNDNGMRIKVITFGGRISELLVPDRGGKSENIVCGFDSLKAYEHKNPYFGATIGRVANRIGGGHFQIDHKPYKTPVNNGPNTLHGGLIGFDRRVWQADETEVNGHKILRLRYFSPDGEEGFPGNMHATATFALTDNNEMHLTWEATSDLPTPVNMTNHSYFNLKGPGTSTILDHRLTLYADRYTPTDENLIPTGDIASVKDTPYDFLQPHAIGERIAQTSHGYDTNYVLNGAMGHMKHAAKVQEDSTGRVMEVHTTQPGIQFYSGNFLDGSVVGNGGAYPRYGALCLETQHFPDSVHHPNFPSTIIRPGMEYRQASIYRFSTL